MQLARAFPIDDPAARGISLAETQGDFHPACGSYAGAWFVALLRPGDHERDPGDTRPLWQRVRDRLERRGFAAFCPVVPVERRHARRVVLRQEPLFGARYLFVRAEGAAWRHAWHVPGIARLLGSQPARPDPVPERLMAEMLSAGWAGPITTDLAPMLLEAGAEVRITDGPLTDQRGICRWSDGKRAAVLLSLFGRDVVVRLAQADLARAG